MSMEDKIKAMFLRAVLKDMEEEREGIHISHLVGECLRSSWYGIKYGGTGVSDDGEEFGFKTETSIITLWLGKKLHETPISNVVIAGRSGHEFTLQWMDVTGTADEILYIDDSFVVVDKKTVNTLPRFAYDRHIRQIQYYALMLYKLHNIKVDYGAVVYIKKALKLEDMEAVKVYVFPIGNLVDIENDFISRVFALKDDVPPVAVRGKHCAFCRWQEICALEDGKTELHEVVNDD